MKQVLGEQIEPLESVQLVETYRRYLKPEKVRVLLLAESHVFTSDEDRQIIIQPHTDLPDYPTQYARFVYCLGYGEQILTKNQLYPKNTGTPPFWKILFSCNNPVSSLKDFSTILGQTSQQKVSNKIKLLKDLKEKGIWLVDTSIVALYKEGAKDLNMSTALGISWQSYTREVVISAKPEHVICIGKGVAKIVENDLKKHFHNKYTVIPQPTRLTPEQHKANYEKCSIICSQPITPPVNPAFFTKEIDAFTCKHCTLSLRKLREMAELGGTNEVFTTPAHCRPMNIYEVIEDDSITMRRSTGKITRWSLSINTLRHVHDLVHAGKIKLDATEIDSVRIDGVKKAATWGVYIAALLRHLGCNKIADTGDQTS